MDLQELEVQLERNINKQPQDIPLLLGIYESVLKKSTGAKKENHLTVYLHLLERIGQPKETLKVFSEILEMNPTLYDIHF